LIFHSLISDNQALFMMLVVIFCKVIVVLKNQRHPLYKDALANVSLSGNGHSYEAAKIVYYKLVQFSTENGMGNHLVTRNSILLKSAIGKTGIFPANCDKRLGAIVESWLQIAHEVIPVILKSSLQAHGSLSSCGTVESGTTRQGPRKLFL
jgi:hypothetical protein